MNTITEKAQKRAVKYVREVRKAVVKGQKPPLPKEFKVNRNYQSTLSKMGIWDKKNGSWNQNGMTDHDIAVEMMRVCRNYHKPKQNSNSGDFVNKVGRPANKPKQKIGKSKAYVYKIFGITVMKKQEVDV